MRHAAGQARDPPQARRRERERGSLQDGRGSLQAVSERVQVELSELRVVQLHGALLENR